MRPICSQACFTWLMRGNMTLAWEQDQHLLLKQICRQSIQGTNCTWDFSVGRLLPDLFIPCNWPRVLTFLLLCARISGDCASAFRRESWRNTVLRAPQLGILKFFRKCSICRCSLPLHSNSSVVYPQNVAILCQFPLREWRKWLTSGGLHEAAVETFTYWWKYCTVACQLLITRLKSTTCSAQRYNGILI